MVVARSTQRGMCSASGKEYFVDMRRRGRRVERCVFREQDYNRMLENCRAEGGASEADGKDILWSSGSVVVVKGWCSE